MYTDINFKTKKELKEAVEAHKAGKGKPVTYFQPGGFPTPREGKFTVEGPQFPQPHKWYASCEAKDGIIISVK